MPKEPTETETLLQASRGSPHRKLLFLLSSLSFFLTVSEWPDLHELSSRISDPEYQSGKLQLEICKLALLVVALYAFVATYRADPWSDPVKQKTLVFAAASTGDVEALRSLRAAGTDLDQKSFDGRTPLHLASAEGHVAAIQYLLNEGAGVNTADRWDRTPLQDASHGGHKLAVHELKRAGAQQPASAKNLPSDLRLRACDAAAQGDLNLVMMLVRELGTADTADYDGRSVLHLAAAEGHADVVMALCEASADINCKDRWGGTPLRDAIRAAHQPVIDVLVANGAELDKSPDEAALKMCVLASKGDVEGIRYLSFNGVSVDSQDYNQRSALHLAAAEGHDGAVQLLLELGADVTAIDKWGGSAVDDAVVGQHEAVVKLLTDAGAKTTRSEEDADLALKLCNAASLGLVEVVSALIKKVGVNAADYDKRSALHLAAAEGQLEVVELLLENKANAKVKDRWGFTPLKDALRGGHQHVVEVLLKATDDVVSKQMIRTRSIVDWYFAAELEAVSRKKKRSCSNRSLSIEVDDALGLLAKGNGAASRAKDLKSMSRHHLRQGSTQDALEGMRKRILQGGSVTESFKMKKGLMFTDAAHLVSKT